jgi:hypothetical protein
MKGRAAIRSALAILNTFTVTLHMNGQSEVMIHGDHAIGETYCLVHQFTEEKEQRKCQTLGIRYYDQFLRQENRWYFAERKLVIDRKRPGGSRLDEARSGNIETSGEVVSVHVFA